MREMLPPPDSPRYVYVTCAQSASDLDVRGRLIAQTDIIESIANDYNHKAQTQDLYVILPNECHNDEAVLAGVTKKELKALYSTQMLNNRAPRAIYDSILARAPLGRCPFCGIGQASTLDHYLPKAVFPQLAVVPVNLVPSCKDCNHGKNAALATDREAQVLHPYYDHGHYISDQWLIAEIRPTSPETVVFSVAPPGHWSDFSKHRVQAHFTDFKLGERYSIEAANELAEKASLLEYFHQDLGIDALLNLLSSEANSSFNNNPNSWQTALYQALLRKLKASNSNTILLMLIRMTTHFRHAKGAPGKEKYWEQVVISVVEQGLLQQVILRLWMRKQSLVRCLARTVLPGA